jgi:hypothetical protein
MIRHLTLIALALVVFACAKEAEKPIEFADSSNAATQAASTTTYTEPEETEEVDTADRARRALWQELGWAVIDAAYPSRSMEKTAKERDATGTLSDKINLEPKHVHVVPRSRDTLIMVMVQRHDGRDAHSDPAMIDLIAASWRNGKARVIDHVKKLAIGQFAATPDFFDYALSSTHDAWNEWQLPGTGINRLGRDIWAWVINDVRGAQGFNVATVRIYSLLNQRITYMGSYTGADNTNIVGDERAMGDFAADWHVFTSHVIPMNDRSASPSDLAIVWTHNDNGTDSSRVVTIHSYTPGKGYDFSNHPFPKCRNSNAARDGR